MFECTRKVFNDFMTLAVLSYPLSPKHKRPPLEIDQPRSLEWTVRVYRELFDIFHVEFLSSVVFLR